VCQAVAAVATVACTRYCIR